MGETGGGSIHTGFNQGKGSAITRLLPDVRESARVCRSTAFALLAVTVLLLTVATSADARQGETPKGRVAERVVSKRDPAQSYALYLPSSYTTERKFPVLYCFDAGGRGVVPVERFKEAAELYGYILVGSNNARNGPNVPLNDIIQTLWEDTHARFSIDDRRVYLAGFSGGARLAFSLAHSLKGLVAGVIACSGGYPSQISQTAPRTFALFATAGTEDFNNPEMQSLSRAPSGPNAPLRLVVFDGGHDWPPAQLCTSAVEWMEIQAVRAGLKEKDDALIDTLFRKATDKARANEGSGDLYKAYLSYSALTQDFSGLREVIEFEKRASELWESKEVRQALKREKEIEEEQERRAVSIQTLIEATRQSENRLLALSELGNAISNLRKAAKAESPSATRTVARRLIDLFFVQSYEQGSAAIFRKDYGEAVTQFSVGAEIQPDNPRVLYHLARAYALAGETKKALGALQAAAEKGFSDTEALDAKEFAALRDESRFGEILEAVRKNRAAPRGR